jgi:hypothetical protein
LYSPSAPPLNSSTYIYSQSKLLSPKQQYVSQFVVVIVIHMESDHHIITYFHHNTIYLEEEAEADPLVVADIAPLLWINSLVYPGMGNIDSDPLPEGAGDCVSRMDPTVGVQHVLGESNMIV